MKENQNILFSAFSSDGDGKTELLHEAEIAVFKCGGGDTQRSGSGWKVVRCSVN